MRGFVILERSEGSAIQVVHGYQILRFASGWQVSGLCLGHLYLCSHGSNCGRFVFSAISAPPRWTM